MWRDETGGIVTGWLLRVIAMLAVGAFLVYEALAMTINGVQLDGHAGEIARASASSYAQTLRNAAIAEDTARQEAAARGATILTFEIGDDDITLLITRRAGTLLAHKIDLFKEWANPTATGGGRWR